MRKITGKELKDIISPQSRDFDFLPLHWKEEWEDRARKINFYFYPLDLDEQSNECPIPTLQEGD